MRPFQIKPPEVCPKIARFGVCFHLQKNLPEPRSHCTLHLSAMFQIKDPISEYPHNLARLIPKSWLDVLEKYFLLNRQSSRKATCKFAQLVSGMAKPCSKREESAGLPAGRAKKEKGNRRNANRRYVKFSYVKISNRRKSPQHPHQQGAPRCST